MNSGVQTENCIQISFLPASGCCERFSDSTEENKVTIWLAPRTIKNEDGQTTLHWLCNLSDICVSDCIFGIDI